MSFARAARQLPNFITAARIVVTPFIAVSILGGGHRNALILLVIAGITDGLDGYLARRFQWFSRLGAYLDPVADKLLLAVVYICLGVSGLAPLWLVAVIFARDVLILAFGGTMMAMGGRRELRPSVWGKISTTFQIVTGVALIAGRAYPALALDRASLWLIPVTAAATLWSGLHYAWIAWRMVRGPAQ